MSDNQDPQQFGDSGATGGSPQSGSPQIGGASQAQQSGQQPVPPPPPPPPPPPVQAPIPPPPSQPLPPTPYYGQNPYAQQPYGAPVGQNPYQPMPPTPPPGGIGGAYGDPYAQPPGGYTPPVGGYQPPPPPPPQPEDETPANFRIGEKLPPVLKVEIPAHTLNFDEQYFLHMLAGSISLTKDEKKKIIESVPKLKQSQIDELIRIFEEEREKFAQLSKKHWDQLEKLAQKHFEDWTDLEGEFVQQSKAEEDAKKAEEIRKQLGL